MAKKKKEEAKETKEPTVAEIRSSDDYQIFREAGKTDSEAQEMVRAGATPQSLAERQEAAGQGALPSALGGVVTPVDDPPGEPVE